MGSFANTLFSVLLGWIQGTVSWLWQVIASADAGAWMTWVLDNWLALVILLCLAGLAVDLVVYLLRWQPYRVWRSFLRRVSGREADEEPDDTQPQWVYADGSTAADAPAKGGEARTPRAGSERLSAPIRPLKRVLPARQRRSADNDEGFRKEDAYHQPYYPPQWHTGEQEKIDGGSDT